MPKVRRSRAWLAFLLSLPAFTPSCSPRRAPVAPVPAGRGVSAATTLVRAATPVASSCARTSRASLPLPLSDASSSVALVGEASQRFAYVADEDDRALRVVDAAAGREIGATELGGAPSDVLVLPDGRVAVSLRDAHAVAVLEPGTDLARPFSVRCTIDVPDEPLGMALTKDRRTLLVASRWGHALTALDADSLDTRFTLDLPRDPRAVVVSDDGKTAFVSHVTGGTISAVDLTDDAHSARAIEVRHESRSPVFAEMPTPGTRPPEKPHPPKIRRHRRFGGQGYALARASDGRLFAALTLAEPESNGASGGYGGNGDEHPPVVADIGVISQSGDLAPVHFGPLTVSDCLLPRAIAVDGRRGRVLVACRGLDSVLTFEEKAEHPHDTEVGRVKVGAGPSGIAVDPDAGLAYVWSTFDRRIDVVSTGVRGKSNAPVRTITIPLRAQAPSEIVAHGRALFHDASARRIASDGRACASCHPDGREDGLTWSTPEGPRQTPMLAGRLDDTAPYGWDGARQTLLAHLDRTLERLHGIGIDKRDRESLFAYISTMKVPARRGPDEVPARRGKAIFDSDEVGCAGCHAGGASTDGLRHDVKSRAPFDTHAAFDTPSLRFVGRTAPFFHDGRFATLHDLLVQSDGKMGHTSQLSPADLDALEAYLSSL
jgi:DNA-binding beta-propeller fold protein YncE